LSEKKIDVSYVPSPYSFMNKVARVIWGFIWLFLFRPSPKPFHIWRRYLLRVFGAHIGKKAHIHSSCRISEPWKLIMGDHSCLGPYVICYCGGGIIIGAHSTVSQYSHLCASSHDYEHPNMLQTFEPIVIEDQVWIAADAFVAPGVTIGQGAIVGARASVFKDVAQWTVVGGNPARFIKKREIKEA
jgi:putative colanic acid biosynthesis acetyltransferase WcaF